MGLKIHRVRNIWCIREKDLTASTFVLRKPTLILGLHLFSLQVQSSGVFWTLYRLRMRRARWFFFSCPTKTSLTRRRSRTLTTDLKLVSLCQRQSTVVAQNFDSGMAAKRTFLCFCQKICEILVIVLYYVIQTCKNKQGKTALN